LHFSAASKAKATELGLMLQKEGYGQIRVEEEQVSAALPKSEFKARFATTAALRSWVQTHSPELGRSDYRVEESQDWGQELNNLFAGKGWNMDNSSLIKKGMNASENEQIEALELKISQLNPMQQRTEVDRLQHELSLRREHVLLLNVGRTLLIILFSGIALLVYLASLKRNKQNP
jgi:hypothetical protein